MGFGGLGAVIAGAQDNGTLYKIILPWLKEFNEVKVVMVLNARFHI